MKKIIVCLVFAFAVQAAAQVIIPIRYRVTRTAPGQTTITHVFLKSAMTCNLATGVPPSGGLRITDPELSTRDCQAVGTVVAPIFANMVREVPYTYTIAGQANDLDPYGPESTTVVVTLPRIPQIPSAPGSPRIVPPDAQTVAVVGTVLTRSPAFGLDVATTSLDGIFNFPFYFGAATLTAGSYVTAPGDRFLIQLWKP